MDALEVSPFQPTIFGAMARHAYLAVTCVILVAGLGFAYELLRAPSESAAVASIVVADPTASSLFGGSVDARYPANQASIIRLPSTAARAAQLVNAQIRTAGLTADGFSKKLVVR